MTKLIYWFHTILYWCVSLTDWIGMQVHQQRTVCMAVLTVCGGTVTPCTVQWGYLGTLFWQQMYKCLVSDCEVVATLSLCLSSSFNVMVISLPHLLMNGWRSRMFWPKHLGSRGSKRQHTMSQCSLCFSVNVCKIKGLLVALTGLLWVYIYFFYLLKWNDIIFSLSTFILFFSEQIKT